MEPRIHHSAIINADGLSNRLNEDGRLTETIPHTHKAIFGEDVEIGPLAVIHAGSWRPTQIGNNTKIGAYVNVGHNVTIGENCLIASGANIGGSTDIMHNCWIGLGALIGSHLFVAPYTVIGMGAVVLSDIVEPYGVWVGNPARFLKKWDGKTQPF